MIATSSRIFSEVKYYRKLSYEFQSRLSRNPQDWNQFQEMFNLAVEKITVDILQFEKENIKKFESKIYKLRNIFEKRYRKYFLYGEYPKWVYAKPFGYAGDYKIIEDIYQNNPTTIGFDRLWDNYFLQMTASSATRERKEDIKKFIFNFLKQHENKRNIRIMNLASGSAREIRELLDIAPDNSFSKVTLDCYDFDCRALDYAKQLLNNIPNINFIQKNAIRIALKRDIKQEISWEYDLIYSMGLFDYLDEKIATRLIANLRKCLKRDGAIIIGNFGEKYSNSSAGLMEWATEWYLIYRTDYELRKIFIDAGFSADSLEIVSQPSKVIKYCFAKNA